MLVSFRRSSCTPRRLIRPAALVLLVLFILYFTNNLKRFHDTISYATRPLWDTPDGPKNIIPHFHSEGVAFDESLCRLHGWAARSEPQPEVWDAIMVSSELDLLEVRMHELSSVVDRFFIVESNVTFTGRPKALHFSSNSNRFSSFAGQTSYSMFGGLGDHPSDPFTFENSQRDHMSTLLSSHLPISGPPPLVIFSDVDEIPAAHTIRLLRACRAPSPLHLQLRDFVYSFEWPVGLGSWRAQVHEWRRGETYYRHSKVAEIALADSGWHCSYCFRTLSEFSDKMQGFSHADRINGDRSLLVPHRIQKVICEGTEIFGMLPEAYRYKDMHAYWWPDPSASAVGLPLFLIQNHDRFRFLLPGGCVRDS